MSRKKADVSSPVGEQRKYRHEYKFLINVKEKALLMSRLKTIMARDPHASEEGSYWIRSLYFDDLKDSAYYSNEDGDDIRTKYRIRIYNVSDDVIHLERKSKKSGMTSKDSVSIDRETADALISGRPPSPSGRNMPELLREFLVLSSTRLLRPRCIVEYQRFPYVCDLGNTRITLDDNISSSLDNDIFFDKNNMRYPVLAAGSLLLEVKFDEYLPSYIRDTLELGRLSQTSFSKYYLGRKFSLPGKGGRLK